MINPLTWLSRRRYPYEPLITVEISRSRLLHNLNAFKKIAPKECVAPVLKSNAYGHGLNEVAKILEENEMKNRKDAGGSMPFFVVDSYFEAIALRAKGIRTPLLVIGYTPPETITQSHLARTSFTVGNIETLKQIGTSRHMIHIHLKIDTGMRRQGILPTETTEAVEIIRNNHSIILEGICSHFADADNTDETFTEHQIAVWNKVVHIFKIAFPHVKYLHVANTDGHRFSNDTEANVSRLGIGLYGLSENILLNKELNLVPVMEMKTIITSIKKLVRGETTGYGGAFKAEYDMTIATVPVGYYEGIDRRLSGCGFVLVGNKRTPCPIIGRVSMNITTIDVSRVPDVNIGSLAIVISSNLADPNSILSMAKQAGTISYEFPVKVPTPLKRVVVD